MDAKRKVYTVVELTRRIKATLEDTFGSVWVEGELSNVRQPASGHYYFTLKDGVSQISAVLFRGSQRGLRFTPADGTLVRAFGEVSVYERSGQYQIIVRQMEEGGQGSLQARFEALKDKLKQEGLFDASRKQPIPRLPQHVGVVTSRTGAAIRDILNVVARRFPNLRVTVAPVKVQGEGAAEEIAEAIGLLNRQGGVDVMIVGRGGGSVEDLWCFNEEVVARAIAASAIPVISAVGHEIDFTISDFVADLRAPTPSAAAELVVERKDAFQETIDGLARRMARALRERALVARNRLLAATRGYDFREAGAVVRHYEQTLEGLSVRARHRIDGFIQERQQRVDDLALRLQHRMDSVLESRAQATRRLSVQLQALSPLAVLGRGYSITRDGQGCVMKSAKGVQVGDVLITRVSDGEVVSRVAER